MAALLAALLEADASGDTVRAVRRWAVDISIGAAVNVGGGQPEARAALSADAPPGSVAYEVRIRITSVSVCLYACSISRPPPLSPPKITLSNQALAGGQRLRGRKKARERWVSSFEDLGHAIRLMAKLPVPEEHAGGKTSLIEEVRTILFGTVALSLDYDVASAEVSGSARRARATLARSDATAPILLNETTGILRELVGASAGEEMDLRTILRWRQPHLALRFLQLQRKNDPEVHAVATRCFREKGGKGGGGPGGPPMTERGCGGT